MLDRIPVKKAMTPYSFDITLGGGVFTLKVDHNAAADLFTVTLYQDGALVCAGEPVVYGVPLFRDVYRAGEFPALAIVPLDESGQTRAVTWETMGDQVFLCVDTTAGEVEHL